MASPPQQQLPVQPGHRRMGTLDEHAYLRGGVFGAPDHPAGPWRTVDAGYAICAEALVRHFGEVCAVDEVDLRIPAGEIYGFLGPNGAGKTEIGK